MEAETNPSSEQNNTKRRRRNRNQNNRKKLDGQNLTKKQIQLSKKLSYILRHGALDEGFNMSQAGFIKMGEILVHPKFKKWNFQAIKEVVEKNNKKRFELIEIEDEWCIRAVQGHTINVKFEFILIRLLKMNYF